VGADRVECRPAAESRRTEPAPTRRPTWFGLGNDRGCGGDGDGDGFSFNKLFVNSRI